MKLANAPSRVLLVISDVHEGLKATIRSVLLGVAWQRCRVHSLRNVLARIPKGSAEMVLAAIRTRLDPARDDGQTNEMERAKAVLPASSTTPLTQSSLRWIRPTLQRFVRHW